MSQYSNMRSSIDKWLFLLVISVSSSVAEIEDVSDEASSCSHIIKRSEWGALKPREVKNLAENPPPYVVVHHSATSMCNTTEECKEHMRQIQKFHLGLDWEDIGYNFLIGGDGNIYEGRGWGIHGAHLISLNRRSIGICLIGNFEEYEPLDIQIEALKNLMECGKETGKILVDYKLVGHKQKTATLCPGKYLFEIIKTWPHFESPTNR